MRLRKSRRPSTRARHALTALSAESGWALLAFLLILAGPPLIANPERFAPVVITDALPLFLVRVYALLLLFGGIGILAGIAAHNPWVERAGLALAIGAIGIFAFILIVNNVRATRWSVILSYVAFGLACAARYRFLGRQIRGLQTAREIVEQERRC